VNGVLPLKAWNLLEYLFMIVAGTRNAQSISIGIAYDWLFNPKDTSGAAYSSEPAAGTATNYFIIPTSNYMVSHCSVGSVISIMNLSLTYVYRRTVTAKTTDSPSSGLTKVEFDGTALDFMSWSNCGMGVAFGHVTGSTDTISGMFGNANGTNNGLNSLKLFGVEDWYGQYWNILTDAAIKGEYVDSAAVNTVYIPNADDHTVVTNDYNNYSVTSNTMPLNNGYTTALQFVDGALITLTSTGGSSSTYFCDYYYQASRTSAGTTWYCVLAGGSFSDGGNDGPFYLNCDLGWGVSYWDIGARSFVLIP